MQATSWWYLLGLFQGNICSQNKKFLLILFKHFFTKKFPLQGVSDAYGKEKDACPDPHDFNILNLSKVGIDDVLDKWQGPKLMGLPDFQKFWSSDSRGRRLIHRKNMQCNAPIGTKCLIPSNKKYRKHQFGYRVVLQINKSMKCKCVNDSVDSNNPRSNVC